MTKEDKVKVAQGLLAQVMGDGYHLDEDGMCVYKNGIQHPVHRAELDEMYWFLEYLKTCAEGKSITRSKLLRLGAWFNMCVAIEANGGGSKGAYLEHWDGPGYKGVPPAMKLLAIAYAESIVSNQRSTGDGYYCCDIREYDTTNPLVIRDTRLLEAVRKEHWDGTRLE